MTENSLNITMFSEEETDNVWTNFSKIMQKVQAKLLVISCSAM